MEARSRHTVGILTVVLFSASMTCFGRKTTFTFHQSGVPRFARLSHAPMYRNDLE